MDTRIGTIALPRGHRNAALPWTIAAVEGFIILALGVGMLLTSFRGHASVSAAQPGPRLLAHADAAAMVGPQAISYGITGTGPGLIQLADGASYLVLGSLYGTPLTRGLVTGTGPSLVEVTSGAPFRRAPVVTGTGPGLIQVAEQG